MKFLFDNASIIDYALNRRHVSGGAERQQWFLARALASAGHRVVVYGRYSKHVDPPKDCQVEGVVFRSIRISTKWYFFSTLIAWWKMLRKERPDWWYWRCRSNSLFFAVVIARCFQARFVFACAFDTDCQPKRLGGPHLFRWIFYAWGLDLSDRILVQHDLQYALLAAHLRKKTSTVPSIAMSVPVIEKRENYVAWVGVLREPKRPHLIAELALKLPEVHFVVCGAISMHRTHPAYAAEIVQRLESCKNISYRGHVSPADAQNIISNAGLFLSTSENEGFPNTFLQAWGAGVPVVSLGVDPGQVIRKRETGVVVNDIVECAQIIAKLIEDNTENHRRGRNGMAYVKQFHSQYFATSCFLKAIGTI